MKLTCPKCENKGEILEFGDDVVFHCNSCGIFRDMGLQTSTMERFVGGSWVKSKEGLEVIQAMADADMSMTSICNTLGMSRPTMYRYAKECPELKGILGIKSEDVPAIWAEEGVQ